MTRTIRSRNGGDRRIQATGYGPSGNGRVYRLALWATGITSTLLAAYLWTRWTGRWGRPARNDFSPFYAAGKLAARGKLSVAYTERRLHQLEIALAGRPRVHYLPFVYPPHAEVLLGLLARLPLSPAYDLWTGLNLACYAAACIIGIRRAGRENRVASALVAVGGLPLVVSTVQGANSGILALGFVLFLVALDRQTYLAPAVFLLSMKPQLLLIPAIVILIRRRPTELAHTVLALIIAALIGALAGGMGAYRAFVSLLAHTQSSTASGWSPARNFCILAQSQALLGRGLVATTVWLAVSVALVALYIRFVGVGTAQWLPLAALTVLVANHLLFHDLVLLYPPAIVALAGPLRWSALALIISPWLDPALFGKTHIHVVVIACLAVLGAAVLGRIWGSERRMDRYQPGNQGGLWKLFAHPRWGSASESGTRSR